MLEFPIKTIGTSDPEYPPLLRQLTKIINPLYYRGSLQKNLFNIAVVGSRKITPYGQQVIDLLINGFAGLPVCIISGMAYGADSLAHQAALNNNLNTVAVLGSGLDDQSIYPRTNLSLAYKIMRGGGALLSAYPKGASALEWHFPARNEIISGMSKATVIVEAAEKSGALITAEFAFDQNREVFAVPGSIFQKNSAGTNNLIKKPWAKLINSAADIINEYEELRANLTKAEQDQKYQDLSEIQRKIIQSIDAEAVSLIEISKRTKIPLNIVNANLVVLEIKNKIHNLGNNCYAKNLTNFRARG